MPLLDSFNKRKDPLMGVVFQIINIPASACARGGLIALYWNWFVRDNLFPTAPTMTLVLGMALSWLGVLLTLASVPDQDTDTAWAVSYAWTVYVIGAGTALLLHALV